MTEEEIERTMLKLVANGEAEMIVDSATGQRKWRLTKKGKRAAEAVIARHPYEAAELLRAAREKKL